MAKTDTTLDSDKNFHVRGQVIDIYRGRPNSDDEVIKRSLVTLVIQSALKENPAYVDLPFNMKSDFELMPHQSVLIGEQVNYFKHFIPSEEFGVEEVWKLEVLTGKLVPKDIGKKSYDWGRYNLKQEQF